jgi:sensor histidine kinase YesM
MQNPITSNKNALIKYIFTWTVIITVHSLILVNIHHFNIIHALTDSFIFNGLFALLGINLWYLVSYSESVNKKNFLKIALNFFLGGFLIMTIWYGLSSFVAKKIISAADYELFLSESKIYRLTSGTLFLIILSLIYYVIIYKKNWEEKLINEKKLQESIKKIELDALKMQINPHFLFNALNSISSLTMTNPELAQDMIIKMSDFLRYALKHNNSQFTTLNEEINNVKRYLEIEQVRFQDKLNFKIDCNLPQKDIKIPTLILQPLFENAIKHGVYNSSESITITLNCRLTNQFLELTIVNNFDEKAKITKGEGVGLQNVADRLRFTYNKPQLLAVEKSQNTFSVKIKIPLNHDNYA